METGAEHMTIEAMKQALEALLDSMDDVRDCLNEALQHEGYAKYDRRIEAYREQIAKHEKAIADLTTAIEQAEKQEPPPECQTEPEKRAYAFGWWKAMEHIKQNP
jgi:prefoldin subunit 5